MCGNNAQRFSLPGLALTYYADALPLHFRLVILYYSGFSIKHDLGYSSLSKY